MNAPSHELLGGLRRSTRLMQSFCWTVLLAFASQLATPTVVAARESLQRGVPTPLGPPPSNSRDLAAFIDELRMRVDARHAVRAFAPFQAGEVQLLSSRLAQIEAGIEADLAAEAALLERPGMPAEIRERQLQSATEVRERFSRFARAVAALDADGPGDRQAREAELVALLDAYAPVRVPTDIDQPGSFAQQPVEERPRETEAEFAASIPAALRGSGDFSDPAYLASAAEVELTDAIRAKAAELGHDPVAIYHFVRNEIEWQASWGGQQSAELTLGARRGNAQDISTLLIALLRASDIPARYVLGSVDVPVDRFINWVGDFDTVQAAATFAASGGIPTTTVVSGGQIAAVRIEHMWVEAAIGFHASRGSVPAAPDRWLALDASYKQYEYVEGIDALAVAGVDTDAIAASFVESGIVNDQEGWVAGLDVSVLVQAQQEVADAVLAHVEALPEPTVGEVLGGSRTVLREAPVLPSGLPFERSTRGVDLPLLTDSQRFRVLLGMDPDLLGDYASQILLPLYTLNQRNIILTFRPASAADEAALEALMPSEFPADPAAYPAFLPNSIRMVPELKRDGEVLLSGNPVGLGGEMFVGYRFFQGSRQWGATDNVVAGSFLAYGVVGSNFSPDTRLRLKEGADRMLAALESGDPSQYNTLGREDIFGTIFGAGIQSYYDQYASLMRMTGAANGVAHDLNPSAGTFGHEPHQRTFFGLVRGVERGLAYMNLRVARTITASDNDVTRLREFNRRAGELSSMLEHIVPEHILRGPEDPSNPEQAGGASAVKLLATAMEQGQRIFHITANNQSTVLPQLGHDIQTMAEIRQALAAGLSVTTHAAPLSIEGWRGSGYTILDAQGNGSYKIAGSRHGGVMDIGEIIVGILVFLQQNVGDLTNLVGKLVQALGYLGFAFTFWDAFTKLSEECGAVAALIIAGLLASLVGWMTTMAGMIALSALFATGIGAILFFVFVSFLMLQIEMIVVKLSGDICGSIPRPVPGKSISARYRPSPSAGASLTAGQLVP